MKQKVKLSTYSILISTVGMAILIGVIILEFKQKHEAAAFFGATGLAFLCVTALIYAPLSISVDDSKLNVNRIIFTKSIPFTDIKSVALCTPTMSERRIFGSGGWLGYWGKCYEPSIGNYFAYYGKASECFLVKLKDGKQYLLGCENPSTIVESVKRKIKD